MKQEGRDHVAALFKADDAIKTRVVQTISYTFTLSKDPEKTITYKHAEIIKELEKSLTPELIAVLNSLKEKYSSSVQKEPSLKVEPVEESIGASIQAYFNKYLGFILGWSKAYDAKLKRLKGHVSV